MTAVRLVGYATAVIAFAVVACLAPDVETGGLDPGSLPDPVRGDYAVFARRCSKCHSLSRPLESGITDDDYWTLYVSRMRRQPQSGISEEDARIVLRFLHYYSLEALAKKAKRAPGAAPDGPPIQAAPPLRDGGTP